MQQTTRTDNAAPRKDRIGRRRLFGFRVFAPALLLALAVSASCALASASAALQAKVVGWGYSDGQRLQRPRGIAFDPRDGAIYVCNTGANRIEVFSRTGRPLARFVHRVTRPDGAVVDGEPCALAFDRSGHLLVADQLAFYVEVMDRRGRSLQRLAIPAGHPAAIAVANDGTLYIGTTAEESKIHRFRADYTPLDSWGVQGTTPGQLHDVTAVAVLADGNIAVGCARADLGVQVFTPEGSYLFGFGTHELGAGNLTLPSGLLGLPNGHIWVLDELRQNIQVFDKDGTFITQEAGSGAAPGELSFPSSLTSNAAGLIAVTDRGLGRFQVLGIPSAEEVSR